MQLYKNLDGDSGVLSFETGPDLIRVQFIDGEPYRYTHESAGREHVERMKQLATAGRGLSTYISQHPSVRHGYVRVADEVTTPQKRIDSKRGD